MKRGQICNNIRPNKIVTVDENIILYSVGKLKPEKIEQVGNKIFDILRGSDEALL
jgi:hypothetical protein